MNKIASTAEKIKSHLLSAAENIIAVGIEPHAATMPDLKSHVAAAKAFKRATPENALAIVEFVMGGNKCLN